MVGRERVGAMGMTGKYHEKEVKELRVSQPHVSRRILRWLDD